MPVNLVKLAPKLKKGGKDGLEPSDLDCDFIGLYFSAHWCPPCRNFTPHLATYYQDWQANGEKKFEIIFVSSDRDQSAFDDYFKEMPWAALKFSEREKKQELAQMFGISGIPTLVILDKNGETVTTNGRGKVGENSSAKVYDFKN